MSEYYDSKGGVYLDLIKNTNFGVGFVANI